MPEATNEVHWPANTNNYTLEAESSLINALVQESESMETPKHYREFINKLLDATKKAVERAQNSEKRANALLSQSKQYSRYIQAAEENYGNLADLYKQEHKANLDKQEEIIYLTSKNKFLEEEQEAKYQKLVQELNQHKLAAVEKLKSQEDDFRSKSTKQAIGRKNIEEKLYHKEMEINELKKKFQDLEQKMMKSGGDTEKLKTENAQLKMLLGYYAQQNPQLTQPHQLQQHLQQQQQQQQQQQPRPPHYR